MLTRRVRFGIGSLTPFRLIRANIVSRPETRRKKAVQDSPHSIDRMPTHQIVMGAAVAALSVVAFVKTDWLLQHTRKGEWCRRRFGELKAQWFVRSFFALAVVFGVLLATNVIRPLQW
jgi:hypothetical protein